MGMADAYPVVSVVSGHRTSNYFHFISLTILYYDHLLTFPAEVQYFWKQRKGSSFFVFVGLRYFSLLANIAVILLNLGGVPYEVCDLWNNASAVFLLVQCIAVAGVFGLRVCAIHAFNKAIITLFLVAACITVALAIWSLTGPPSELLSGIPIPGCIWSTPRERPEWPARGKLSCSATLWY
ncbi:hypothetical protein C8F01DRAFT_754157 [Mycena amicta]|nr:hypothetical protein C8F01DRAFT_754157 [Mycena amicta]